MRGWFYKPTEKNSKTMKKYFTLKSGLMMLAALVCFVGAFVHGDPSGIVMGYLPFTAALHTDGTKNMGGTQIRAYFCPISAITSEPALVEDPDSISEALYLAGSYACASQKNFIELYLTPKTGGYKAEPAGDLDGECYKQTAEFFHPGTKDEIAAFAAGCLNTPGVLIMVEENGERLVMGNSTHPCYLRGSLDIGKNPDDRKGFTFAAEAFATQPIIRYNGAIPISGGEVEAIS